MRLLGRGHFEARLVLRTSAGMASLRFEALQMQREGG